MKLSPQILNLFTKIASVFGYVSLGASATYAWRSVYQFPVVPVPNGQDEQNAIGQAPAKRPLFHNPLDVLPIIKLGHVSSPRKI